MRPLFGTVTPFDEVEEFTGIESTDPLVSGSVHGWSIVSWNRGYILT